MLTLEKSALPEIMVLWRLGAAGKVKWQIIAARLWQLCNQVREAASAPEFWSPDVDAEVFKSLFEDLQLLADIASAHELATPPNPKTMEALHG